MKPSILFIDCTEKAYNTNTHATQPLGGIERCILGLSAALSQMGFAVSVWNNTPETIENGLVNWYRKDSGKLPHFDIVIACNDARLFDDYAQVSGKKDFLPILWFHNPVSFGKTLRKRRILPLLRWRPIGVFLGKAHKEGSTKFLSLRSAHIIEHGIEDDFFTAGMTASETAPPPVAIFISQAYRGLTPLLKLWRDKIHSIIQDAAFHVYSEKPAQTSAADSIRFMGRKSRSALLQKMKSARVCLIPGHDDETFCLAAAECSALGIPIITYGTGALKERVRDGVNGYIAKDEGDFAAKLSTLLTEDAVWQKLHTSALKGPHKKWNEAANEWTALFGMKDL